MNGLPAPGAAPAGALVLIPVALGDAPWPEFLPIAVQRRAASIRHFVVENARAARARLKQTGYPGTLRDTDIRELAADAGDEALDALLAPALAGEDIAPSRLHANLHRSPLTATTACSPACSTFASPVPACAFRSGRFLRRPKSFPGRPARLPRPGASATGGFFF